MFLRRYQCLLLTLLSLFTAVGLLAQQGTIKGSLTDDSGAAIPGAAVSATGQGVTRTAETDIEGSYSLTGLPPGNYSVIANHIGFAQFGAKLTVLSGRPVTLNMALKLETSKQEVTVQGEAVGTVSVDATQNAGQLVLRQEEIDALPDDPDDLASDLQALAGPSAGPNGGQIFIDGFTGGRLPPKESIREIRINQNPFSSEFDRVGFGRIEILTKPGTDKFRGQAFFNDSEKSFDARNPYSTIFPDFNSRQFGGNVSGAITKKSSFFIDFDRRNIADASVANGSTLDSNFNIVPFSLSTPQPQHRTSVSPRVDYQLSTNNTLVMRYAYQQNDQLNAGLGFFDFASRANNYSEHEHQISLTETAVLGAHTINETRFRYEGNTTTQNALTALPGVQVSGAFSAGGSGVGISSNTDRNYEFQNYTSIAHGAHSMKFGMRMRADDISALAPSNFNGNYSFQGSLGPALDANNTASSAAIAGCASLPRPTPDPCAISSIEQYRRSLLFAQLGYSPQVIRQLGGGASQFSISGGQPFQTILQHDEGFFYQDDWRVKPNLTLSLGLRYEIQNNISDWHDIAPRIGIAWSPDSHGGKPGKTVIRAGSGIFYDRVGYSLSLAALRFNGVNQQRYVINCARQGAQFAGVCNATDFTQVPTVSTLAGALAAQTLQEVDPSIRAPYLIQTAFGIERQLPHSTSVAINYTNSHGLHELLTRNINAPIPGTVTALNPNGAQPFGTGNIYQYESNGILNQNQFIINANSRFARNASFFAFYVVNFAKSNGDGVGSFPSNQYNLARDYGRSSQDVRNRFVLGGSLTAKWNVRLSPFIMARSGLPYNITTGQDINGDSVFTDRPSLIPGCTSLARSCFNATPGVNDVIIPRNYAQGPSSFTVNLRLSKTWGIGEVKGKAVNGQDGGMRAPGGGFGGAMGGGGRGGRGGGGYGGGEGATNHRYNLTFSANVRNLLNTNNPGNPIGVLTSPLFGQSNSLSFGPGGTSVTNRRLELGLRFAF
jgi:hypothetical protein